MRKFTRHDENIEVVDFYYFVVTLYWVEYNDSETTDKKVSWVSRRSFFWWHTHFTTQNKMPKS